MPVLMAVFIACFALIDLLAVCPAQADTPPALPPALMWQGKPVDPACIVQLAAPFGVRQLKKVDLNVCSKHPDLAIDPKDLPLKGPDYGYSWTTKTPIDGGYTGYRYIGDIRGLSVVLVSDRGGGTGVFSAGAEIRRDGDTLYAVKRFEGGDRCDEGIANMEIKKGTLIIESNTTPASLLILVHGVSPREDNGLSSPGMGGAFDCIGTLNSINGKVVSFTPEPDMVGKTTVKLSEHLQSDGENARACFDKLLGGVPTAKPWTLAQIEEFADHFQKACLAK